MHPASPPLLHWGSAPHSSSPHALTPAPRLLVRAGNTAHPRSPLSEKGRAWLSGRGSLLSRMRFRVPSAAPHQSLPQSLKALKPQSLKASKPSLIAKPQSQILFHASKPNSVPRDHATLRPSQGRQQSLLRCARLPPCCRPHQLASARVGGSRLPPPRLDFEAVGRLSAGAIWGFCTILFCWAQALGSLCAFRLVTQSLSRSMHGLLKESEVTRTLQ